ncbi:MAG: thiamine-phosphate kinase [Mycobacteriaceae bacterium]|nr:thiamine-phosphate kinase [Mycobacteriaceae bacterium]
MSKEPTLADLGEFAVIDRLVAARPRGPATLLGPGDDAAIVAAPDGRVVVSTDMLVESRHFRLDWSTPRDIGRKAIAQNAADIEAMGATPTGFVVAFGAPAHTPVASIDELADGMWSEARRVRADIVGGDLVSSPQWVVSVTALGDLAGRAPVTRSGATPGSVVAVCGDLGQSAAGYALWHSGFGDDPHGFDQLCRRHLVPEPPYGQGAQAAEAGARAMTDVSDGLTADLRHVAEASGVGIELSTAALVADHDAVAAAAALLGENPWDWVLGGGEDHALVATFDATVPEGWRVIGVVVEGSPHVLVDGAPWQGSNGWQAFG